MDKAESPFRIVIAPAAQIELLEIWEWTAKMFGVDQADLYISFLRKQLIQIRNNFAIGRTQEGRELTFSHFVQWRTKSYGHFIYYDVDLEMRQIQVLHFFHSSMDWGSRI